MDRNTRRDRNKTEDIVALDGVAALGQLILYVVDLLIDNERIRAAGSGCLLLLRSLQLLLLALGLGSRHTTLLLGLTREPLLQYLLDREEVNLLQGDHRIYLTTCANLQHLAQIGHGLVDGNRDFPVLELALQLLTTDAGVLHLLVA